MSTAALAVILGWVVLVAAEPGATGQKQGLSPAPITIQPAVMHAQAAAAQAASAPSQPATTAATDSAPTPSRALVNRYCVTCHNQRRPTPAGDPLMLDS